MDYLCNEKNHSVQSKGFYRSVKSLSLQNNLEKMDEEKRGKGEKRRGIFVNKLLSHVNHTILVFFPSP